MPALQPVPGVARVVCNGLIQSVPTVNVFHIRDSGQTSLTQAQVDEISTKLRGFFVTRLIPIIGASWTLGNVDVTDLSSDTGAVSSTGGSTIGTGGSATSVSAGVAQCITWKIARHYRGGHPRTYLPPPGQTNITNPNTFLPAHVTAVNAAAIGFLNDVVAASFGGRTMALCCVHRYRGYTWDEVNHRKIPTPLIPPLVDNFVDAVMDSRIDSMRRRLGPDR